MFYHENLPRIKIINDDTTAGRYYFRPEQPEVRYRSVTTIIGQCPEIDHSWLQAWKDRVGIEAAARASQRATDRGTALHNALELFLLNQPIDTRLVRPDVLLWLDEAEEQFKNISKIYGVEYPLWSDNFQTAGTADMLAEWKGLPVIIDHKTTTRPKSASDIFNYFIQVTIYAIMASEQTGIQFNHGIIMMFSENAPLQLFKFRTDKYRAIAEKIFRRESIDSQN